MEDRLSTNLFSYRQITELDEALFRYDVRLFFSKLPMFVILILISVVILYYVITLSSLVVEQQRGEIVLLKSRGSSAAQVLSVYVLEGVTIAVLAIAGRPPAGRRSDQSAWHHSRILRSQRRRAAGRVPVSPGAYMMSALGGLLSFAALMIPAVQASRMSVTTFRHQSARPYTQPFYQRYYLDVLLLVVGVLLLRQLSEQGSVVAVGVFGEVATDQLLLAVPAVVLVASALVLLRLFPLFMRISSALLSSFLSAGLVLGIWQMARNPTHYARLSLMLILMAGLGIFAASFGGTLQRSFLGARAVLDRHRRATGWRPAQHQGTVRPDEEVLRGPARGRRRQPRVPGVRLRPVEAAGRLVHHVRQSRARRSGRWAGSGTTSRSRRWTRLLSTLESRPFLSA